MSYDARYDAQQVVSQSPTEHSISGYVWRAGDSSRSEQGYNKP